MFVTSEQRKKIIKLIEPICLGDARDKFRKGIFGKDNNAHEITQQIIDIIEDGGEIGVD